MNTQLQELLEEIKVEKEKAHRRWMQSNYFSREEYLNKDYYSAFFFLVEKLTKILNEGSVAASSKVSNECDCYLGPRCNGGR